MPVGTPKIKFIKHCGKCGKEFDTYSNVAKYCLFCRTKVVCVNCKKEFIRTIKGKRKNYCESCEQIEVYCKCGCGEKLDFERGIKGGVFIHGHARRGKKNTTSHNLAISKSNKGRKIGTSWNKGKTKEIDGRLSCSEETKQKMRVIALEKGYGKWMLGKKRSEETKQKMKENTRLHFVSEETKEKISKANSGVNNGMFGKTHTKETKNKISKEVSKQIISGTRKRSKYKTGYFYSDKNKKNMYYRSSYELIAYGILEQMKVVKKYESEPMMIPYGKESERNYVPDILIEYVDGKKEIIEIKPERLVNEKTNVLKFCSAKEYCRKKGLGFSVWTETKLFNTLN
jgi:hypothetical protein